MLIWFRLKIPVYRTEDKVAVYIWNVHAGFHKNLNISETIGPESVEWNRYDLRLKEEIDIKSLSMRLSSCKWNVKLNLDL